MGPSPFLALHFRLRLVIYIDELDSVAIDIIFFVWIITVMKTRG